MNVAKYIRWKKAQAAEKRSWIDLWQPTTSKENKKQQQDEIKKGEFIIEQMAKHFKINPKKDWKKLAVLDVACGPVSFVARYKIGEPREGVDPLRYPAWVYEAYKEQGFKAHRVQFEKLKTNRKYDIVTFYNALQHFADLPTVGRKCADVVSANGKIYVVEYVDIPPDDAHIQVLTEDGLNTLFKNAGFKVKSVVKPVRLPGLVEMGGGQPIKIYMGQLTPIKK